MSTAAVIAGVLERRGYDYEIAHIFALEAAELGRLTTCQALAEAVEVVADMLSPNGIFVATERPPRRVVESKGRRVMVGKSCGKRSNVNHRDLLHSGTGTWLIA